MTYDQLSDEAKETLKGMVEYCINGGIRMGMDEGVANFETGEEHAFVTELREFVDFPKTD